MLYPWAAQELEACVEFRSDAEHRKINDPPIWELQRDYMEDFNNEDVIAALDDWAAALSGEPTP